MHLLEEDLLEERVLNSRLDVSQERSALAAEALRQSGRLRMRVYGESMLPTLWPGDELEIVRCSVHDAHAGDVVLAVREGHFFLHRFVARCKPGGFFLQGDSMPTPDPKFPDEALIGRLAVTAGHSLWSRAIGRVLCFCSPARRLALRLHELQAHRERAQQAEGQSGIASAFDHGFDGV
jgi:hypothetical protein